MINLAFDPEHRMVNVETGETGTVWHAVDVDRFMALLAPTAEQASWNNALYATTGDLPGLTVRFFKSSEQARAWLSARMRGGY